MPKPIFKVVRVKPGQTIGGIANRHDTSVRRIVKLNHLKNANRIFVGQKLRVPAKGGGGTKAAATKPAQKPVQREHAVRIVVVKAGDTLGAMALRYDTTVAAIVKANKLKSADHIYPGQRLRIP